MSSWLTFVACLGLWPGFVYGQEAAQPAAAKPADRLIGVVTAVDAANKTITIKEDKTNDSYTASLASTKTFLHVPPGEKDLKKATRIEFSALAAGDRVALRGKKGEGDAKTFETASVLQMTAEDLQQKQKAEVADWQKRGAAGTLTAVDAAAHKVTMNVRTADGTKPVVVELPQSVEYVRYSPASVKFADAKPSSISELQVGDQVRVLGNKSEDGATIVAERVISGAFRSVAATILSISPDGKEMKIDDLLTKQPVVVSLTDETAIRKLPPFLAMGLARRINPQAAAAMNSGGEGGGQGGGQWAGGRGSGGGQGSGAGQGSGSGACGGSAGAPGSGGAAGGQAPGGASGQGGPGGQWAGGGGGRAANGDLSQVIERLPKISISELKAGDAVIVSGGGSDKSRLTAINIVGGVEALFASAPPRAGQNTAGAWNLDISNIGGPGGPQ